MDKTLLHAINTQSIPELAASRLKALGIATLEQFLEAGALQTKVLERIVGADALAALRKQFSSASAFAVNLSSSPGFIVPPLTGIAGPASLSPALVERRREAEDARRIILERLQVLREPGGLPARKLLTDWMMPVQNQGPYGYCVGFGSTATREFLSGEELSPGWAYRGAKALDGRPDLEGSWQIFALEFMAQVGHVRPGVYSYEDAIAGQPLQPFFNVAQPLQIAGYVDLLLDAGDFGLMPTLIKSLLCGVFSPDLGPQPIPVSLALHESFLSPVTATTGLMRLPLPGERRIGGHAMCIVGYVDADDPDALYGLSYFLVRNSFGDRWAPRNPLGHVGHALIPETYFLEPEYLWECLLCLAERSPASPGWLSRLLRLG